ncbi:MAG: mechanosensitive ion channel domain-containing protein [Thermoplasmata archaeon]
MAGEIEWIWQGILWLWEFVIISLIFAIIILIVGYIISKIVKWLVVKVLYRLRFDELFRETGLVETVRSIGFRGLPEILGLLVFWFVFLFFIAIALDFLRFLVIAQFVTLIIEYLPRVFGAVLIALGGLWLGTWLSKRVKEPMEEVDVPMTAETTATIVKWLVIFIAIVMALGLIGIDTSLLVFTFSILIAALGAALAISFGIGGRDVAANVSAYSSVSKMLKVGDEVTIDEYSGIVLLVGRYGTVLKKATGEQVTIPNAMIAKNVIVKKPR